MAQQWQWVGAEPYSTNAQYHPVLGWVQQQFYNAPPTFAELTQQMLAAEDQLPADLRISGAGGDPGSYTQQWYNDNAKPLIAELQADLARTGRDSSTYGAAESAALQSNLAREASYAGEDMADRYLQRTIAKRGSLFGNLPAYGNVQSSQFSNMQAQRPYYDPADSYMQRQESNRGLRDSAMSYLMPFATGLLRSGYASPTTRKAVGNFTSALGQGAASLGKGALNVGKKIVRALF